MLKLSSRVIDLTQIKGEGWTAEDNLHEIKKGLGRLGVGVTDLVVSEDTTLAGHKVVDNLFVVGNALLSSGNYSLTVRGNCVIKSARLSVGKLVVHGDLVVERAVGDSSYTNVLTAPVVHVHGNTSLKNTGWTITTGRFDGDVDLVGSNGSIIDWWVGGNYSDDRAAINQYGTTTPTFSPYHYGDGTPFSLRVDGSVSWPNLAALNTHGKDATPTPKGDGGHGADVLLSVGAALLLGGALLIDASGGNGYWDSGPETYEGGDGGDVTVRYGSLTGFINTDVSGGTGYNAPGVAGVSSVSAGIAGGHHPHTPAQIVPGDPAGSLEWQVPVDANGSFLDFRVEIGNELSPGVYDRIVVTDSNSAPADFGGAAPWPEGVGHGVYDLPDLPAGEYVWRVTAIKDGDVTNESIPSAWLTVKVA